MSDLAEIVRQNARAELARRRAMKDQKEEAEQDLLAFVRMFWRVLEPEVKLVEGWVLDILCDCLMSISDGHLTRVCINVPPGSMKSTLLNVFYPAWEWGPQNTPHMRYLSVSYSTAVPERDNIRFARLIKDPVYQSLWGDRVKLVRDGSEVVENNRTGWKRVTSTGGSITGLRGDRILCIPYGAVIETNHGPIPIGRIVDERLVVKVLGYGPHGLEWQDIDGYSQSEAEDEATIHFEGGAFTSTCDHPVWIEGRGWTPAARVQAGDTLWVCGSARPSAVSEHIPMHRLWGVGLPDTRTPQETSWDCSVQPSMFREGELGGSQSSIRGDQAPLPVVRRDNDGTEAEAEMLFSVVLRGHAAERDRPGSRHASLPVVQGRVSAAEHAAAVLQSPVLGVLAFQESGGPGERQVRPWRGHAPLPSGLDQHAQDRDQIAGWQPMLPVPKNSGGQPPQPLCASYRLRQGQSVTGEPDHAVPSVPRSDAWQAGPTAGVERTVVTSVGIARGKRRAVFNLRVTPDHTYFADGLLTHNCDDLNNPSNIESEDVRATATKFVREIMPDRLNSLDNSAIINLQQRTHEQDATGILIEYGQGYDFLCIPMEFDPLRISSVVLRRDADGLPTQTWTDPRALGPDGSILEGLFTNARGEPRVRIGSAMARAEGTLCWPERFSPEAVRKLQAEKGPYAWASQYLQFPGVRGGSIVRKDWWKLWAGEDFPEMGTIIVSVDTAVEEGTQHDFNACTVWGAFADTDGSPQLLLIDGWKERMPLAKLVGRVEQTCRRRRADYLLIEHKTRGRDVHDEIVRLYQDATWQTILIKVEASKVARLKAVEHLFSGDYRKDAATGVETWDGGIVWAPDKDWADEIIGETASFPFGAHDDYVDTVSMALGFVRKNGVALRRVEYEQQEYEAKKFKRQQGIPYAIKR